MSRARRGNHFLTNAVPFFAFMVGGSYGISVLLQARHPSARPTRSAPSRAPPIPPLTDARSPPPHLNSIPQGRNDVRDARADVTDMRAPSRTQNVRRKNRAFDLEEENRVRHRLRRRRARPRRDPAP